MHGELMEFNEHLQRQLLQKENVVKQLSSELVELRGPVCHIITLLSKTHLKVMCVVESGTLTRLLWLQLCQPIYYRDHVKNPLSSWYSYPSIYWSQIRILRQKFQIQITRCCLFLSVLVANRYKCCASRQLRCPTHQVRLLIFWFDLVFTVYKSGWQFLLP